MTANSEQPIRLVCRRATSVVLVAALLALLGLAAAHGASAGKPQLDDGKAGPGMRWDPGMLLVRFRAGTEAKEREAILRGAGVDSVAQLPLVPGLFEVRAPAGTRVMEKLAELDAQREVLYAQPDLITRNEPLAASPLEAGYWPNDPYFWPSKFSDPNQCQDGNFVGQWDLWGTNLSNSANPFHAFNPVPAPNRAVAPGGLKLLGAWASVNVMPVWNLLKSTQGGDGRLGDPGRHPFTSFDIERSGVAVQDTGLSDHEDIKGQVAAVFSTVNSTEEELINGVDVETTKDRLRQVYRDNPGRDDLTAIGNLLQARGKQQVQVQDNNRQLFAFDDAGTLSAGHWSPTQGPQEVPVLPWGCDGHGTYVGSLAGASANNGKGIAGIGYDIPLIGLRPGMPWDRENSPTATNQQVGAAKTNWTINWRLQARTTTETDIQALLIVEALDIPVLNMSYGSTLFAKKDDANGNEHPVVRDPAFVEALGRLLSKGKTLGVAAAGNHRQLYGTGPQAVGARLYDSGAPKPGAASPCGIKLVAALDAWVSAGDTATEAFSAARQVDWDRVNLLCVAATTSTQNQLADFSGSGPTIVEIAAPGQKVTGAYRPKATPPFNAAVYGHGSGTSYSSPLVAGAAALLREAAPGAPMQVIAEALRRGARPVPDLVDKVAYGQLDVACSLAWLRAAQERRRADWGVIDPAGDADFARATSLCGGKQPYKAQAKFSVNTRQLFDAANKKGNLQTLLLSKSLLRSEDSNSMRWQDTLLRNMGSPSDDERLVFNVTRSALARVPVKPSTRIGKTVYDGGHFPVGCSREGYLITRLSVFIDNFVRPRAFFYPTDAKAPGAEIDLGLAFEKPALSFALPGTITVKARVDCEFFLEEIAN
jgi:hypothetical protein